MDEIHVLGFMFGCDPDEKILSKGRGILEALEACGRDDWPGQLLFPVKVSRGEARAAVVRIGSVSELQLSIDQSLRRKEVEKKENEKELRKFAMASPSNFATNWKGKCYRR